MTRTAPLLALLVACERPTIDGLLPADDPDLQYIEWVTLPSGAADLALVQQLVSDSERAPVAFVGASWCGSCQAYKQTLEGDTMKEVHAGVQVLELDLDHHRALLAEMNIRPAGVPHWEAIGEIGLSIGQRVDGRRFPKDTEAEMAPVLKDFFDRVTGG